MKNIKKALIIAAAAIWGGVIVFGITRIYKYWQDNIRTPDVPLYPTELVYKDINDKYIRFDVYRPNDTLSAYKTILYIHGGTWIMGTKRKVQDYYRYTAIKTLLENNIQVISLDYRLINLRGNSMELCIQDCYDAYLYCIENAQYLKIDTTKIGLWGSSAGAHLAMMSYLFGKCPSNIKLIIDDFGPTDLSQMWGVFPGWIRRLGCSFFFHIPFGELKDYDAAAKKASPLYYAEQLSRVPILISHGEKDPVVKCKQSKWLHDSLPNTTELWLYPGLKHGFKTMDSTEINLYTQRVMNFVNKNL